MKTNNKTGNEKIGRSPWHKDPASAAGTIQRNIETVMALEKASVNSRSKAERLADKVTSFAGNTPFIIFHILWFGGWILVNCGVFPAIKPFDPFPFSFLTLVVSLEAIFLTLLVL